LPLHRSLGEDLGEDLGETFELGNDQLRGLAKKALEIQQDHKMPTEWLTNKLTHG
jgi:hypothetical protein